jgi:hypothetical protein
MISIGNEIINYKKSCMYNATIDKLKVICVIKRVTADVNFTQCEQLNRDLTTHKVSNWPKLELSGLDSVCQLETNKPTKCYFLMYTPQVALIDWDKTSLLISRIHERLSTALNTLHNLKWQLRACDLSDIMAVDQADPNTYYFVNYNNIHYYKNPDNNKKLKSYNDHLELITSLIKNPLDKEKIKPVSDYAFYKYLIKSSVYPEIAKLIHGSNKSDFLKKIKLLFFFKHFDLYLRAKNVPEHIFNKYQKYKHHDAQYFINFIIHKCG